MRAGLKSYVKVMTLNHADSSSIAFRDTAASGIACNYFSVQCRNLSGLTLTTSAEVGYFFVAPSAGHVMSSVDLTPVGNAVENGPESGSGTVELIIRKPLYSNAIVASATQGHYVDITASAGPYPNTDAGHGAGGVAGYAANTVVAFSHMQYTRTVRRLPLEATRWCLEGGRQRVAQRRHCTAVR